MILGYILAFAAGYSEGGEGGGGLLSVNPGLAFWTVITFLILLVILRLVAWKPILQALDERETKIKESLEQAEKARQEAAKLIEENRQNMAKADDEARKLLAEAQKMAEKTIENSRTEAKQQAEKIISDAQQEIDRKKIEALNEIKTQIAEISVSIAEKVIRRNLTEQVQQDVVDQYIRDIKKN